MFRPFIALSIASCLTSCDSSSQRTEVKADDEERKRESPRVTVVKVFDEPSRPIGDLLKNLRKDMTPLEVRKWYSPDPNWCLRSTDEYGGMTEGFELEDDVFIAFKYIHSKAAKSELWSLIGSPEEDLRLEKAMVIPILMRREDNAYVFTRDFDHPLISVEYGEESEQAGRGDGDKPPN